MELIGFIIAAAVVVIALLGYVKAPPDTAFIISGLRKHSKIIVGRSSIRIPFLERLDKIPLNLMQVDIKTNSAVPTAEYINIFVDGVANIKVSSDLESIRLASQNFLGRKKEDIANVAQQVLEGNMREIVGQMKLSELVQNRDKFATMVQENAMGDMRKMGLEIVNLTIQNFVDQNKVIEDLGMDNVVQIKKDAAVARARGERDIAIATSNAKEEANLARTEAEAKIAKQNNDLLIKQAALKLEADTRQAEADAAYDIQKQEQRKIIEVASANADIARKEREVLLQERQVEFNERELDAEVRKRADAERYALEQKAQADLYIRQKDAEAKNYEVLQEAEAQKAQASADRFAKEQEAVGIQAVGLAEAEAIRQKAEAMRLMGEASMMEMYLQALPEVVKNAAMPLAQTEKIVMYGDGNSTRMIRDVMNSSNQIIDGLTDATGMDIKEVLSKFLNKNLQGKSPLNFEETKEETL
ncbi:SPFH domain-containing protein [Oscillospiraceae bacterium MB08-C2-2]|nr:SPFH domain-containing protein [Oscillospiraceae bacterium MB08-C2-2]